MSTVAVDADKLNVFISYSRADLAFADEIVAGLEFGGFAVTIDRHSIREGEEWKARLSALIANADTVIFVLSPDSAQSSICSWEVEEAARLAKRILPVLCRPVAGIAVPARLAELNYVRFDENRSFMGGLKSLVQALNTDLTWLRDHTRLLSRALDWQRGGRTDNRLMSGKDIEDTKVWVARRPRNAPALTELQLDFIKSSEAFGEIRRNALRRELEERERLVKNSEQAAKERSEALAREEDALRAKARLQKSRALVGAITLVLLAALGWFVYGFVTEELAISQEAKREDIRGQIVSYATVHGGTAADQAPGFSTSPYSTVVSDKLGQKKRNVVDALVDAHKHVTRLSEFKQRPFLSTSMNGHIYLARQPTTRRKRAILISADDPNVGEKFILKAPPFDAEAVMGALLTTGFAREEVVHLRNPDRTTIEQAISTAATSLRSAQQANESMLHLTAFAKLPGFATSPEPPMNTLIFFFFSGHGVEVGGVNYLVPKMAHGSAATPQNFAEDAVALEELTRKLDQLAAMSIVVLDTHFPHIRTDQDTNGTK